MPRGSARRSGEIILDKLKQAGFTFAESRIETLGRGRLRAGVVNAQHDPPEVVLRVAVRDSRRAAIERFTKELRATSNERLSRHDRLHRRPPAGARSLRLLAGAHREICRNACCGGGVMAKVPLSTIAHGRSGDKGNHANVAVIAYTDAGFAWLKQHSHGGGRGEIFSRRWVLRVWNASRRQTCAG